jgi:hypothetical protein
MKKIIVTTAVCCSLFAAYVAGQNQTKQKIIEPCCCKHTQQIAEDLHWIREQFSKPYKPPEIPLFEITDNPPDAKPLKVQKMNIKIDETEIDFPKLPPKPNPKRK